MMEDKTKRILKIILGCRNGNVSPELAAVGLAETASEIIAKASQNLVDAIIATKWQEFKWDGYINAIATGLHVQSDDVQNALIQLLEQCEIYFDASKKTKEEKEWFIDDSSFAKALSAHKLFSDQIPEVKSSSAAATGTANGQTATSTQTSTQAASGSNLGTNKDKNNHLSRAVVGQTLGQKEIVPLMFMYKLNGLRADSRTYNVNICPRSSTNAPYKIKLTSGNGAEDCVLFFKTVGDAQAFADKVKRDDAKNKNVLGNNPIHIGRRITNPNGYLKVETAYGPAYIVASKLNEADDNEAVDEDIVSLSAKHFPKQEDFNSYDDYLKSCCEQFNTMLD